MGLDRMKSDSEEKHKNLRSEPETINLIYTRNVSDRLLEWKQEERIILRELAAGNERFKSSTGNGLTHDDSTKCRAGSRGKGVR